MAEHISNDSPTVCPGCGAALRPDFVICVKCGLNFKTGKKIERSVNQTSESSVTGETRPLTAAVAERESSSSPKLRLKLKTPEPEEPSRISQPFVKLPPLSASEDQPRKAADAERAPYRMKWWYYVGMTLFLIFGLHPERLKWFVGGNTGSSSDCPISVSNVQESPAHDGGVSFHCSNSANRPVYFTVHVEWTDKQGNVVETKDINVQLGGGQSDDWGVDPVKYGPEFTPKIDILNCRKD